jgi:hypothetical protein
MSFDEDEKKKDKALESLLENQNAIRQFMENANSLMEEEKAERNKQLEESKNRKPQSFYIPKFPHWTLSIDGSGIDDLLKLSIGLAKVYPQNTFKISEQQFKIPKQDPEKEK